jgi:four helix bundle protein
MAARLEDLVVWQLATQIQQAVLAITAADSIRRQFRFCAQLESAARSVPANVAEGFARFTPGDFARFLRYARGSLAEVEVYLSEAEMRRWTSAEQTEPVRTLARRFAAAAIRLGRYLESTNRRT